MAGKGSSPEVAGTAGAERVVVITRLFDAPRELVFKAWTDAEHVQKWWGPGHGFTNPVCEVDARPGGEFRIDMRSPDGAVFRNVGVFREVVEPERLVFTSAWVDDAGNPKMQILNTVTFADESGKTKLTVHARVLMSTPEGDVALAGMEEGWKGSLDQLAAHLQKKMSM